MINPFIIKKYAALLLIGMMPAMTLYILDTFFGFWIGVGGLFVSLLLFTLIAVLLIKNPFSMMLEGKGLLTLNIDSTGIIRPFVCKLNQPYVRGQVDGKIVTDVYDRETVAQIAAPGKAGQMDIERSNSGNKVIVTLDENRFNQARFQLWQYPVLIYNAQIKTLLTKEYLSQMEKQAFAEHGILYLNRKMEELTAIVRDFGRYVVELTKPQGSIFQNKWFKWVLIVAIIVIVILFAKPVIEQLFRDGSSAGSSFIGSLGSMVNPQ